jgi:hypothetical protein
MFSMGAIKQRVHNINMKIGRLRWEFANKEPLTEEEKQAHIAKLFEELEVELEQLEENI